PHPEEPRSGVSKDVADAHAFTILRDAPFGAPQDEGCCSQQAFVRSGTFTSGRGSPTNLSRFGILIAARVLALAGSSPSRAITRPSCRTRHARGRKETPLPRSPFAPQCRHWQASSCPNEPP